MHVLLMVTVLGAAPTTRIAVFQTQLDEACRARLPADLLEEAVLAGVQNAGRFEVIGQGDLEAVLGLEEQRDLLGCQQTSCVAEIAGALDVDKVVTFKLAWLEEQWAVGTKVISLRDGPLVEERVTRLIPGDVADLMREIPRVLAELFPEPEPEPEPVRPPPVEPVPASYDAYRYYIGESDWRRWMRHVDEHGPTPLANWVYEQNRESTALTIAEAVSCAAAIAGTAMAAGGGDEPAAVISITGWAGCIILPIFDAFDIDSVRQMSPPPTVATRTPSWR